MALGTIENGTIGTDRHRRARSLGGLVAHPVTGLAGSALFWNELPHRMLVAGAIVLGGLGLSMLVELLLTSAGRLDAADRLFAAHIYGHAAAFAALPWFDLDATGRSPADVMLLVALVAGSAGYTGVSIDVSRAQLAYWKLLGGLGVSYAAAFLVAGAWVSLFVAVLWAMAMSLVAHLGHSYLNELVTLREESERAATIDDLTGLWNRPEFVRHLEDRLGSGDSAIVGIVDLDRFKWINDTLGHHYGDQVLIEIATRLRDELPDDATAARLGGDEFAFLVPWNDRVQVLLPYLEALIDRLEEPIEHSGRSMRVKASMGITRIRPGGSPSATLAEADLSMYRSKRSATTRISQFDVSMRSAIERRAALEQELRTALDIGQIVFHGQPITSPDTLEPTRVELLARWIRPDGTVVSPAEFVPVAEETGLVSELGRQALHRAVDLLLQWRSDPELRKLGVSLNISPAHLGDGLAHDLARAVDRLGTLDPSRLGIEFVESELISEVEGRLEVLDQVADLGVSLIIDDFGVGYSSLTYLRELPMSTMKLDRSFIAGLDNDDVKRELTKQIVSMAHAMELPVVAEGVETEGELDVLADLDVWGVQGYFIARPQPIPELEATCRRLLRDARGDEPSVTSPLAEPRMDDIELAP